MAVGYAPLPGEPGSTWADITGNPEDGYTADPNIFPEIPQIGSWYQNWKDSLGTSGTGTTPPPADDGTTPPPTDGTTTPPPVTPIDPTQYQSFLNDWYQTNLGRDVDADALTFWSGRFDSGEIGQENFGDEFWKVATQALDENGGYQGYVDTYGVDSGAALANSLTNWYYDDLLGRAPDEEGLGYWSDRYQEGDLDTAGFRDALLASAQEFIDKPEYGWSWYGTTFGRDAADTLAGSLNADPRLAGSMDFIDRVNQTYQQYLGRDATQAELDKWTEQWALQQVEGESQLSEMFSDVTSAGASPEDARAFFDNYATSFEGADRDAFVNDLLTDMYSDYAGRAPDEEGLQYWSDWMANPENDPGKLYDTFKSDLQGWIDTNTVDENVSSAFTTYADQYGQEAADELAESMGYIKNADGTYMTMDQYQSALQYTMDYGVPNQIAHALVTGEMSTDEVPWQTLYDPLQKYYWQTALGGKTVQTRDMLGYDDPYTAEIENLTLEELQARPFYQAQFGGASWGSKYDNPLTEAIESLKWNELQKAGYALQPGMDTPWLVPSNVSGDNPDPGPSFNADALRQFGDWKETNIQDFINEASKWRVPVESHSILPLFQPSPELGDFFDPSMVDFGELSDSAALQYLFFPGLGKKWNQPSQIEGVNHYGRILNPAEWLEGQGIDLREGTGWDWASGATNSEDPFIKAMQQSLLENGKINRPYHFASDLTDPGLYDEYFDRESRPLERVAEYLNQYGEITGNTNINFEKLDPVKQWSKAVENANPSSLQKFVSSPVFGIMASMVMGPAGLGVIGPTASLTSNVLAGGILSGVTAEINGGDFLKGFVSGAVSSGLSAGYADKVGGLIAKELGVNPSLAAAITSGVIKGGVGSILGGEFLPEFMQGAMNYGVGYAVKNDLLGSLTNEALFNKPLRDFLTTQAGKAFIATALDKDYALSPSALVMAGINAAEEYFKAQESQPAPAPIGDTLNSNVG